MASICYQILAIYIANLAFVYSSTAACAAANDN